MEATVSSRGLATLALVAAAAFAACYFLRPSEEKLVKAAFARAAETVSKAEGESMLVTATRVGAIADLATGEISVSVPEMDLKASFSRQDVAQRIMALRASCSSLTVRFEDVRAVSIDGNGAKATADMLVTGVGASSFLSGRDTREVSASLAKSPEDGKWRFSSVTVEAIVGR